MRSGRPPQITIFVSHRDSVLHILGRASDGLRVASRMLTYLDSLCEAGIRRNVHSLPAVFCFVLHYRPARDP